MLKYEHLLMREWRYGTQDCYGLARSFYDDNFGIKLRNYARPNGFWKTEMDLYAAFMEREGFRFIDAGWRDLRPGDGLLMAIRTTQPCHCAVYLGDNKILHHFIGRRSETDELRGVWRNTTVAVVRHPDVPDLRESGEKREILDFLLPHKRREIERLLQQ